AEGDGMSTHRDGGVPAARRYRGRRATDRERLAALIAAATAPARASELAGEQEVLRAYRTYREAHPAGSPAARRRSMLRLALAKLLTVKAAVAAAAVTAAGGAALAATGTIPNPISGLGSAQIGRAAGRERVW